VVASNWKIYGLNSPPICYVVCDDDSIEGERARASQRERDGNVVVEVEGQQRESSPIKTEPFCPPAPDGPGVERDRGESIKQEARYQGPLSEQCR